jgi:serine/threonine protein kinase
MPKTATLSEVVEAIRASRLVAEPRLREALGRAASSGDAADLLHTLVAGGQLTPFQARRVARGRGRELTLGHYRLLEPLGKGGTGVVYRADHPPTGRVVAVKVLTAALAGERTARARLAREARAAAAIDHPNVVRVFDVRPGANPPYLVMEYVEGVTLQSAVARRGPLPAGVAAALAVQVARGLGAVAAAGLVHRDIKPANVILDRTGVCKILDHPAGQPHDPWHGRLPRPRAGG